MSLNQMFNNKKEGKCPFCHQLVKMEDFTDALSIKEFKISGICQKCQNGFFTEEE